MGTMSGDFAGFFAAAWPRLYPMAAAVAGERGAAEDALQAAFAKAYSRWDKVCAAEHPEAYVRRTAQRDAVPGARSRAGPTSTRAAPRADRRRARGRRGAARATRGARPPEASARSLGCSRGTVKSQASAALASLRRLRPDLVASGLDAPQEER